MTTTKKDLQHLLQMVYDGAPDCTCRPEYIDKPKKEQRIDPTCHRHFVYSETQLKYIGLVLSNLNLTSRMKGKLP